MADDSVIVYGRANSAGSFSAINCGHSHRFYEAAGKVLFLFDQDGRVELGENLNLDDLRQMDRKYLLALRAMIDRVAEAPANPDGR